MVPLSEQPPPLSITHKRQKLDFSGLDPSCRTVSFQQAQTTALQCHYSSSLRLHSAKCE
jgi:hypothetical protein